MFKFVYKMKERAIVFNSLEWSMTGDTINNNQEYFQKATILNRRLSKYGEKLVDVIFDNGTKSNGHFERLIKPINDTITTGNTILHNQESQKCFPGERGMDKKTSCKSTE